MVIQKGNILYKDGKLLMVINGLNLEKKILTHTQGDVENGRPNGVRIMTTKYGEKYLGKCKNAAPNGQGKLTVPNGSKYIGEWKDDKMWNITLYNKDGDIFGKWVNGKFVNI